MKHNHNHNLGESARPRSPTYAGAYGRIGARVYEKHNQAQPPTDPGRTDHDRHPPGGDPVALPLTALFLAMGLEWTGWGQGKLGWGPRLGALLILVMGQVAFALTPAGAWLNRGLTWVANLLDTWFTYLLGAGVGNAVASLIHWLPAALIGAYWIAAFLPGKLFKERMTWRLAWTGLFLPTFIGAIPGPAGSLLTVVFSTAAVAGAAVVGFLFSMASSVRGAL